MPKLFVIPGHGAGDPGAGGHGFQEAERVRALATEMKRLAPNDVTLGDFNRNYYADNGISSLVLPKDTAIIELHLDSASASAKGGHVIIKEGYQPDKYDIKLADNISRMFPGRSNTIVGRGNLANVNRAAKKGFNYRLVEVCFISNKEDITKFNSNLEAVAKSILEAFDIGVEPKDTTPHNVFTADFSDDKKQLWWIRGEVKDGNTVSIRNAFTGEWLSDPNSSTASGTSAQVWGGTGNPHQDNPRAMQEFVLRHVNGAWTIEPKVAPGLRLDVNGASANSGAKVQFWAANDGIAQQFLLYAAPDKPYRIISCAGIKPLTVN